MGIAKRKLTHEEWLEVVKARQMTERGFVLRSYHQELCQRAWKEDNDRYEKIVEAVKNEATK